MRCVKPDGSEKRSFVFLDKRQDSIHDDAAVVARHVIPYLNSVLYIRRSAFPWLSWLVSPTGPIVGRNGGIPGRHCTGRGKVRVKSVLRWRRIEASRSPIRFFHPSKMPFAKETSPVAFCLEHLSNCNLTDSHSSGVSG